MYIHIDVLICSFFAAFVANERKHVDDFNDHPNRSEIVPITQRPLKFIVSDKVRCDIQLFLVERLLADFYLFLAGRVQASGQIVSMR